MSEDVDRWRGNELKIEQEKQEEITKRSKHQKMVKCLNARAVKCNRWCFIERKRKTKSEKFFGFECKIMEIVLLFSANLIRERKKGKCGETLFLNLFAVVHFTFENVLRATHLAWRFLQRKTRRRKNKLQFEIRIENDSVVSEKRKWNNETFQSTLKQNTHFWA